MLNYVTSNKDKITVAKKYLSPLGIDIKEIEMDLEEIQSESGEEIIKRKAKQAFSLLKKPLIVSDHFWRIPALNGFPGAYMKYMNSWLSPQDFLNLMAPYKDRRVFLDEYIYYIDGKNEKLFKEEIEGKVLDNAQGSNEAASRSIVSLRKDGKSIAECWEKGLDPVDNYIIWEKISNWLKNN